MREVLRDYLSRPDRLNIIILVFGFLSYLISYIVADSKKMIIPIMILVVFFVLFLFAYFISIYTISIFLSLIFFIYFFNENISYKHFIVFSLVLVFNAFFFLLYLKKMNYITRRHVLDFNGLLKIFIFSNASPVVIAGIVLISAGKATQLLVMILSLILIANFYFWHNFVQLGDYLKD